MTKSSHKSGKAEKVERMLFDTNVFIYLEKRNPKAVKAFEMADYIEISAITYMELIQGARDKIQSQAIEKLLRALQVKIIELNEGISITSRMLIKQYSQSHGLNMGDALIAGTAIYTNSELLTANYKDFRYVNGLTVVRFAP